MLYAQFMRTLAMTSHEDSALSIVSCVIIGWYYINADLAAFTRVNTVVEAAGAITTHSTEDRVTVELYAWTQHNTKTHSFHNPRE